MADPVLKGQELLDALAAEGLADWQGFPDGLRTRLLTRTFAAGLDLVARIGELAERRDHHPDVRLTFPHVDLTLISHDAGGVTVRDLRLAGEISALAREAGIAADPAAPVMLELGLDTAARDRTGPFWAALLTGDAGAVDGDDVVDPSGRVPTLWFQGTDPHDVPRRRCTWTSGWAPIRPRPGSPPLSRPEASSTTTPRRRLSPCSPMRRATAPASARSPSAAEGSSEHQAYRVHPELHREQCRDHEEHDPHEPGAAPRRDACPQVAAQDVGGRHHPPEHPRDLPVSGEHR